MVPIEMSKVRTAKPEPQAQAAEIIALRQQHAVQEQAVRMNNFKMHTI